MQHATCGHPPPPLSPSHSSLRLCVSHRASSRRSTVPYAKRYFKYLAKKYLKRNDLRDFYRVIANSKIGYELRHFKTSGEEEAADD
jgi:hypothetical protein